jgi:hypothetical protein
MATICSIRNMCFMFVIRKKLEQFKKVKWSFSQSKFGFG